MKEFLKSFRRKLAFLLAVLLVLGNVNWEAMVRAEGEGGSNPAFTIRDSIQYGTDFGYDSNGNKIISVDRLIQNASEGNIYTITAVTSGSGIAQKSDDGTSLTITGYGSVNISIKENESEPINKEIQILQGSINIKVYEENNLVDNNILSYGKEYIATLEGEYCPSDILLSDSINSLFSPGSNGNEYTFRPSQVSSEYSIQCQLESTHQGDYAVADIKWEGKVEPATYEISLDGKPVNNEYTVGVEYPITISSQNGDVTVSSLSVNSGCTNWNDKVKVDFSGNQVTITPIKKIDNPGFNLDIDVINTENPNYQAVSTVQIPISSISQGSFGDITVKRGDATLEAPITITYNNDTISLICQNTVTSVGTWGIKLEDTGGANVIDSYFDVVQETRAENVYSVSLTPKAAAAGKTHTIVIKKEDSEGNYSTVSKELTITVNNGQQSGISFTGLSNQADNEHQITVSDFNGGSTNTLDISEFLSGTDDSATLSYQLLPEDTNIASFGTEENASILTLKKPCGTGVTVKVVQTKEGYDTTEASFKLKILGTIKDLKFTNEADQTIEYNPNGTSYSVSAVVNDTLEGDDATINYSIVNESTTASATVDENTGEVTISGVGDTADDGCATVVVRATASHVNYKTQTVDYTFKVKKAIQTAISGISVDGASDGQIIYNSDAMTHGISVSTYESGATLSYSIKSVKDADGQDMENDKWGDIVTLAGDTLTLKAAGKITFTVTAQKDNYFDATEDFTLEVVRAPQTLREAPVGYIKDPETDKYLVPYGKKTGDKYQFENPVFTDKICSCANHKVTYTVTSPTVGFASVDENGVVTFEDMKEGDATITASIPACSHYSEKELSYRIKVAFSTATIDNINISGTENSEGWYKEDVKLTPKGDYTKIGTSQSFTGEFNTEIPLGEAKHPETSYYLQKEDGTISQAVTVPEIKVDKSAPSELKIHYSNQVWTTTLNTLTFGFFAPKVTVTLEAKDTLSGVNQFEYWYLDEEGNSVEGSAKTVTLPAGESANWDTEDGVTKYTFSIDAIYRNKIGFKAIDRAENFTQLIGDRILVAEKTKPIVDEPEYSTYVKLVSENGVTKYFYKDQATLSFSITEANFWASDFNGADTNVTFKINNTPVSPSWTNNGAGDVYSTTVKFGTNGDSGYTEDGEYQVSMTYADPCKNGVESEDDLDHIEDGTGKLYKFDSNIIVIDRTPPVAKVTYSEPKTVLYNDTKVSSYAYNDPETTKINKGYKLYYADDATVYITITEKHFNASGVDVIVDNETQTIASDKWERQENTDTYKYNLVLSEGEHTVKISYTDYAEHKMEDFVSETIIVEKALPTAEITFSENVAQKAGIDATDKQYYKVQSNKFGETEYVEATVKITTSNFYPADVKFGITQEGLKVPNTNKTYEEFLKEKDGWDSADGVHTKTVKIPKTEGTYGLQVEYTGLNGANVTSQVVTVVVDDTVPVSQDKTTYSKTTIKEQTDDGERIGYVYGEPAVVKLELTETNFNADDVKLTVKKNGEETTADFSITEWSRIESSDVYACTIVLGTRDGKTVDGDYQVFMEYTDRSNNKMDSYQSKYIIVDATKPSVDISYASSDPTAVNGTYYGSNRAATITVQDRTILDAAKLNWEFTAVDVKGDTVSIPEEKESAWAKTGNYTWTKKIDFSTDAKYDFTVAPVDILGKTDSKQESFTIDKAKPTNLTIRYSDTENWYDNVLRSISFGYYNEPITVTLTATDVTSPVQSFTWSYARQGDNTSIVETDGGTISKGSTNFKQEGSTATATFTLPREEAKQYRGNISFTVLDMANHSESKADAERVVVYDSISPTRTIAFTDPVQVVKTATKETVSSYDPYQKQDLTLYYNTDMVATFTVTEANFYPQDMLFYVNNELVSDLTWAHTAGTDVYTAEIPFTKNGSYVIKIAEYSDRSKNEPLVAYESNQIVVDKDTPTLDVKFSENIAKNAKDNILYNQGQITEDGKATITVVCNNFRASDFILNLEGSEHLDDATKNEYITYLKTDSNWVHEGNVHTAVLTFDKNKIATYNMSLHFTGLNKLETETIAEKLIMDVNVPTLETVYEAEGGTIKESGSTRYVYGGATTLTLNLTEDYFMEKDVVISVIKDGNACPESDCNISEWVSNGTKHTKTIELGTGDVDGDYQIFMSYADRSGNAMESLVSRYIIVDTKKPVIKLDYAANDPDVLNSSFYGSNRTATLTVQDRTIVETEKLSWTFTALNMLGQTVTIPEENITDWALDTKTHTWTRVVKLSVDAIYSFSLNGTDALGNTSDTPIMQNYTMDTTAPVDLKIDYSEGGNWVNNVLGAISFGYYKTPITVTLTAKDITSPIDYFDWTYTKRAESNNTPATAGERITSFTQSGDTATATFTLTPEQAAQYCGNVTFTVTNKAGHQSTVKADENRVIVADTITPTRVVEFTPATQVINKTSRQTVETYDPNSKQDLILFYDKPMTITLKVTEANFYPQDAVVTVNDAATDLTWTQNGDEYTTTVTFSADGDYVFKMTYADRSGNVMETYESSQITIDTVSPTISVDIVGSSSTGEYDGTKYYSTNTSAIITIVEHNFRAADVTGSIVALSSAEQGVGIQDFAAFLSNEANWVTEGDTHIASYPMTTDATYNFQVEYTDLAKHSVSAATGKYCVDKEAPTNVSLTYSTPVVETLLEAISFKFYNAQATVSVAAVDETAGVNKIVYSLLKADGASDTNLELLEQTITEETFTYSNGRREATAQFKLPASELRAGTQFNGTIKLIVYDRAMNNVAYENNERVIIDNIAPQLDIQYNDSTNERDNILYYGEEIRATLHMNEANFYREDVKVTVSRNNGGFEPITVNWSDTNADVHIGNFTLSEDGDYVVMVEYTDKSTNQMVSYTSEQMTIDTDMPVVTISGVENRKPYASGTVGFTVSVSDTNLDSDSFAPQFSAWVKEGNTIVQKDMFELGSVTVGNDKDSCTYVVDNLPEDGIYTISTSVMDMVGHTVDSMHMDNENGTENDFVRFSVNRNGSTYYIDDATTLGMLGSFVPYDKAGNVVVREVNPTALNDVTVTMFKDEKTITLEENSNFAFNLQHNEGEWYEYSYTIYRTNFEEDGIYSILLHSRDEAEHVAENTLEEKNVTISFAIDSTNPVLIISNLEDGATYNANSYTVYMQASDNLKLSEAVVSVDDKKVGSWTEAEQTLSDDDTYEFTINENNRAQKVSVSLVDKAGNRTTQDYSVTVTTNAFVRVINNKPLLFGIVGGATGAVVVPTAGIALFGKKKLFFVLLNKLKGVFIR